MPRQRPSASTAGAKCGTRKSNHRIATDAYAQPAFTFELTPYRSQEADRFFCSQAVDAVRDECGRLLGRSPFFPMSRVDFVAIVEGRALRAAPGELRLGLLGMPGRVATARSWMSRLVGFSLPWPMPQRAVPAGSL